jgi:hypothetical protein
MQTVHLHNFPGDSLMTVRVHHIGYEKDFDIIEVEVHEAPKIKLGHDPDIKLTELDFKVKRLKFKRMFRSEINGVVHYDFVENC